jgi:hypothetical protein
MTSREQELRRLWSERLATALPNGTTPERALAALNALGVEHGAYHADTGAIAGVVRDVGRTATTRTALQITLIFGADRALRARHVEVVRTGP